jgi:hypothetical protein
MIPPFIDCLPNRLPGILSPSKLREDVTLSIDAHDNDDVIVNAVDTVVFLPQPRFILSVGSGLAVAEGNRSAWPPSVAPDIGRVQIATRSAATSHESGSISSRRPRRSPPVRADEKPRPPRGGRGPEKTALGRYSQ